MTGVHGEQSALLAAVAWQGGARRLLGPRVLLKDSMAAPAPSSSALASLLGNSMGPASGDQMYMVVGFEVMACSIARVAGQQPSDVSCIDTLEGKPPAPQEVHKGAAGTPPQLSVPRCTLPQNHILTPSRCPHRW